MRCGAFAASPARIRAARRPHAPEYWNESRRRITWLARVRSAGKVGIRRAPFARPPHAASCCALCLGSSSARWASDAAHRHYVWAATRVGRTLALALRLDRARRALAARAFLASVQAVGLGGVAAAAGLAGAGSAVECRDLAAGHDYGSESGSGTVCDPDTRDTLCMV